MNCTQIRSHLLFYIQEELDDTIKKEISIHLTHCKKCQEEQQTIKSHLKLYQNLPGIEIADHWDQLLHHIQSNSLPLPIHPTQNLILKYWKWAGVAAIFLLLFTGIWWYNQNAQLSIPPIHDLTMDLLFDHQPQRHLLHITFSNLTSKSLILPMDEQNAALILRMQNQHNHHSQPLFGCVHHGQCQHVILKPGENHAVVCDITPWIQDNHEYTVAVDYQTRRCSNSDCTCLECQCGPDCQAIGGCQCAQGMWAKVCSSKEIKILAQK